MPFEAIAGNSAALERLKGILRHDRPAHAYLFSGPDGVGKKLAATEFARALGARIHLVARPEDRREILIEQIREIIRELSFTSAERRAIIIDEADRMSEEGMNALLKTLEEPPRGTVIILVSGVPQRLLATLRSRCQTIYFFSMSDEILAKFVREKLGLNEDQARALALLAGGSAGTAIAMKEDLEEILTACRELQSRVLAGELNPIIEALGKIRDTDQARRAAKRELQLLTHCLREVLRSKSGHPPCLATPAFIQTMGKFDEDALIERIETLFHHERLIDLNANVSLTVEDALLRL